MSWYENIADQGLVPDFLLRMGIRTLNGIRLNMIAQPTLEKDQEEKMNYINKLKESPIAIHTDKANEQHYEVPTDFIKACLGKRMKYSGCLYSDDVTSLDQAEEKMLELYCERAHLKDGQKVMDLGCGWGSLALFLAEKYPNSSITALSNSSTQKQYIDSTAKSRSLTNLTVITGDIKLYEFDYSPNFDRILSIEMFEHMKNYQFLLKKVSSWLKDSNENDVDEGLLFIHIFCHKTTAYDFVTNEDHSWMAKYFFTGGTMPSLDLFLYFQQDLAIQKHWYLDGKHYAKTCNAWLQKMDQNSELCLEYLKQGYGQDYKIWFNRWRIFYMACAETFDYNNGQTWGVGHYLFKKK